MNDYERGEFRCVALRTAIAINQRSSFHRPNIDQVIDDAQKIVNFLLDNKPAAALTLVKTSEARDERR